MWDREKSRKEYEAKLAKINATDLEDVIKDEFDRREREEHSKGQFEMLDSINMDGLSKDDKTKLNISKVHHLLDIMSSMLERMDLNRSIRLRTEGE